MGNEEGAINDPENGDAISSHFWISYDLSTTQEAARKFSGTEM